MKSKQLSIDRYFNKVNINKNKSDESKSDESDESDESNGSD